MRLSGDLALPNSPIGCHGGRWDVIDKNRSNSERGSEGILDGYYWYFFVSEYISMNNTRV